MKRALVIAVLALAAGVAGAETLVARQGNDVVRIETTKPCTDPNVLRHIPKELHDRFNAASARIGGQNYAACATPLQGGAYLVFDDGDQDMVPRDQLKPEQSI